MKADELVTRLNQIPVETDKNVLKTQLLIILEGMKEVSEGFLKIALAANTVKEKKLHKHLGYSTFDEFCGAVIGMTRKQVSLYIRIAELSAAYPELFDEKTIMTIGPTKMDVISRGINIIESHSFRKAEKKKRIIAMLADIDPSYSVYEIEDLVSSYLRKNGLR